MIPGALLVRWGGAGGLLMAIAALGSPVQAQIRLVVSPDASLAWWQVQPHMGHLWATTCPEDPHWYAGAAHSAGYRYDIHTDPMKGLVSSVSGMANTGIPIYPRPFASALCTRAIRGEISAGDSVQWRDIRGIIVVQAAALVTGEHQRDDFARKRVLETDLFPDIRFEIDSLTGVDLGDTLDAVAVGTFELHGVRQPAAVPIKAWREPLGLRVTGQWAFPAPSLVSVYHISKYPLGLGVGMQIWRWIHMGFDVILVPKGSPSLKPS
jgi:hypothetical protein